MILSLPGGKKLPQKMEPSEFAELVKNGILTADTPVSRTPKGKPRAAGSYPEINQALHAHAGKAKVDQKTIKYRELYAQIDQEGENYKKAKKWKNIKAKTKGFAGFILWMIVVVAIIGGGVALVWWLIQKYGG
jgi:hypothetical protein